MSAACDDASVPVDPTGIGPPILTIPLVVRIKILSHLTLKEQLILRQACHTFKNWIEVSSLVNHIPRTILENHGFRTFTKFLQKRPPHFVTKLRIENINQEFLADPSLPCFMQTYSSQITSLHVKTFFTCKSNEEMQFYEGFSNLTELEIDKISISSGEKDVPETFPSTFKNLKTLKIGSVKAFPEPPDDLFGAALIPLDRQQPMGLYVWNLIGYCEKVEYLGYPKTSKYFFQAFVDGRGRGEFGMFCDYVRRRGMLYPDQCNLKICDFQNDNWSPDTKNALPLLKLGNEYGIRYLNVNANLFQFSQIEKIINMYNLALNTIDCILSFKNFNCLVTGCLPSVEKISLTASEANAMLDYSCVFGGPFSFPNLREIEIIVDVGFTQTAKDSDDIYHRAREFRDVRILLSHFFYDMNCILENHSDGEHGYVRVYENVESLIIKLPEQMMRRKARPEDLPLQWITKGLPNVRKLKLGGWNAGNDDTYHKLWERFIRLEEVIFEDCENITVQSFVHNKEPDAHSLQYLKNLVRVSLKQPKGIMKQEEKQVLDDVLYDKMSLSPSDFLNRCSQHSYHTWTKL